MWIIEVGTLIASVIGVVIAIVKLWGNFSSKLEKHRMDTAVDLKEMEIRVLQHGEAIQEIKNQHEQDLKVLGDNYEKSIGKLHQENREDHGKLFNQLGQMMQVVTEVSTSLKVHIHNEELRNK